MGIIDSPDKAVAAFAAVRASAVAAAAVVHFRKPSLRPSAFSAAAVVASSAEAAAEGPASRG